MTEYRYPFTARINIDYPNLIERGAGRRLGEVLSRFIPRERSFAIIADDTVAGLHANTVLSSLEAAGWKNTPLITFPAGERSKSQQTATRLIDQMMDAGVHRRSVVLALGGGVCCDTVGYVACTYMRGIDYVNVPTSLIGQVDASIGGKVAVNHPKAKNFIGAFWHPLGVVIDPDFLATLPLVEVRNGLAEAIKVAIVYSERQFEFLEEHADVLVSGGKNDSAALERVIAEAVEGKIAMLLPDPFEVDLRRVLNFGHTFAHALEVAKGYYLRHGFAVAIGMALSTRIALNRGVIDERTHDRIINVMRRVGLPTSGPPIDPEEIWEHAGIIRKIRANHVHYVMPKRIGEALIVDDLTKEEFLEAYTMGSASSPELRAGYQQEAV